MAVSVAILGLVASFAVGRGSSVPETGTLLTLPTTTTTTPEARTTTTIVILKLQGAQRRVVLDLVAVPNVVGMTLGQANRALSAVGLSSGGWTSTTRPSGQSPTGTVLAQAPSPGLQVQPGQVVQLAVSGY